MKKKFIHVGKRTLSVVLSIMMIVSTMLIGTITNVSAATAFTNGEKIYLDVSNISWWTKDGRVTEMYLFGTSDPTWVNMKLVSGETTLFVGEIPATGTYEKVIFVRKSQHSTGWTNNENQTIDITDHNSGQNLYTFTGQQDDGKLYGTWSTYSPASSEYTYALIGTSTIKSGDTATEWNSATAEGYNKSSSLKFTDNQLTVTANSGNEFRFIGTNGTTEYKYFGSPKYEKVTLDTEYTTTAGNTTTYAFPSTGTFQIEILSGTASPLKFKVTEVTTTTTDYFVAGSDTLCGNAWDPGDTNNIMTKNEEDGTYSKTYNDVNSGSYEFKITDGYKSGGNSWNNSWGWNDSNKPTITPGNTIENSGGNVKFTTTAKSDITITFDPTTKNISVTVLSKTQTFSVTFAAGTDYTSYGSVTAYNDTATSSITSGSKVNSGDKVTFTATPNDASAYKVGGWYTDASCTSQITSAGTSTTYTINSVTANTEVYVKFVPVSISTTNYYVVGRFKTSTQEINWSTEDTIKFDKYSDTLYKLDTGRTLAQLSAQISGADPVFAIKAVTESDSKFYGTDSDTNITDTTSVSLKNVSEIGKHCMKFNLASDPNPNPVTLCLDVTNPDAPVFYYEVVADTEKYSVSMEQGISTRRTGKAMGSSYLDNVTTQTTVTKSIEDLTVTFTTATTDVSADETTLDYTGKYMYQVYGYSINMKLYNDDGTTSTRVASVVNNLVDSNSAKPISALANGVYTCEYTFPSNIISATVTPIFSVSADYAKAKGISYTAVYLKMTPGSNLLGKATEPKYYTWRAKADGDNKPTPYLVGDKKLEREPEGAYGGQKMLYIGNDMYVAYVQSDLYGILFDNGTPQTFDFNEFIKLQKLGYNNITFEPKSSTQSVASTLHNKYKDNGVRKYEDSAQQTVEITPDNVNTEFELDVDIEGYYIDVFGNKLIDTDGNAIKRSDFVATLGDASVSDELSALREKTRASTEIYGARYGSYDRPDSDYGMRYSVYNYYVSGGETKKLISQQVSGYGTIEGAMSPKNSSKTNAAYQASLLNPDYLTYFDDSNGTTTKYNFTTGYELIPETYKGAPYLVSYKTTSDNRTDGKWYYMNTTPQVTVNVKASLLNSDGTLNMADGKIVENTTPGTATVNYKSFDTIDQGTSAVMRATPNEGFAFVGFYEENGDFISKYNPYGNKVFAVDTTVYAVFKEVGNGSITITNNIYDSAKPNPTPGGGNGKVSVTLVITPWNKTYDEQGNPVYGTPVTYTGETSVSATIQDGDLFHIVLTGERSGADNFLAFRMPDKDIYGNIYYVALDDAEFLNVTKDTNGKAISATYETADMVWDWTEQLGTGGTSNTLQAKTFNYYTDFSKTDINATLEYRYKDRFGNWKTYIVKNVPMDVSQINEGNYVPADSLVLQYAPPIDEVFNSCSWTAANIDARNSYALLEADQTYKTFNTYVDRNADGIYSLDEKIVAPFNESIQIEAPETKGSATFKYWKRYLLDSKGAKLGSGEIFSNMRSISIKVTFDSAFEPVYDAVSDTYFTNVQDAKYTREKSTDDKGFVYDYVYADFLLQFDTLEGNDTFKNIVAKNGNIKFGVILEMDYNYTYKPTPEKPNFTAPKTDNDLLKKTIENLNTGLADGGHNSGWNATTDSKLDQYNYYYNLYDLTDKASNLSNFGRYDYFFKFDNTEANRARVYNVYSYIIYTDSDRNEQIVVSNPKTLSIYATGIKNDGETAQV